MSRSELEAKLQEFDELQHSLTQEEFVARFKAEVQPLLEKEMLAHGAHEPDWEPLELVVPFEECTAFMFMGYEDEIRIYKHGHTRKCLYLDPMGNAYERAAAGWRLIDRDAAVEEAFDGLEAFGFTRTTPFTKETVAKRHKIIERETGIKLFSIGGPAGPLTPPMLRLPPA